MNDKKLISESVAILCEWMILEASGSIAIRKAKKSDADELDKLKISDGKGLKKTAVRRALEGDKDLSLAIVDGKIAGFIGVRKIFKPMFWIQELGVDDEYRGMGVGKKLYKKALSEMPKGLIPVLKPLTANAEKFWKNMGFELLGKDGEKAVKAVFSKRYLGGKVWDRGPNKVYMIPKEDKIKIMKEYGKIQKD